MNTIAATNTRKRTNVMIPDHVFAALVFVFVEIMFYSALMSSFVVMRRGRDSWGQNDAHAVPAGAEAFNGLVLALSAACLLLAVRTLARQPQEARSHLLRATGLAFLFSIFQITLGFKLYAGGVTLTSSVFAGSLYLMLGSHLLQALGGSLGMALVLLDLGRGRAVSAGYLKGIAVFWCFLAAIWPMIYGVLTF